MSHSLPETPPSAVPIDWKVWCRWKIWCPLRPCWESQMRRVKSGTDSTTSTMDNLRMKTISRLIDWLIMISLQRQHGWWIGWLDRTAQLVHFSCQILQFRRFKENRLNELKINGTYLASRKSRWMNNEKRFNESSGNAIFFHDGEGVCDEQNTH